MRRDFPVPERIRAHADAWLAAEADGTAAAPAEPRHAATVMVLRPGPGGPLEVFMMRRTAGMAFAAGMHVFPGGGLDQRDADPGLGWYGTAPERVGELVGADAGHARALVAAAVRETFEECGVLLAGRGPGHLVEDVAGDDWERDRLALAAGEVSLAEVLGRRGLGVRADLLHPWAHWVTPVFEPRRFDTRFFVAALPVGQQARDLGGEADHAAWLAPGQVLRMAGAGEAVLMPPTRVCLEELAAADGVAQVLATPRTLRRVVPRLLAGPDGVVLRAELP